VAFAGHRAGRWNFFLDLDQLKEGDEIFLDVAGYRFVYLVEWVEVFDKYDWSPIDSTDYPAITLQTCEPKHVSNPDYRLMVRGALSEVVLLPVEAPPAN
jgi:LPXTG-site transpeptidase (sortase) family protein